MTFPKWIQIVYKLYTENASFVRYLHCLYRQQNFKCVFSMHFFKLKFMFRYHFLGHFLAELIEICCGSLLNSIVKTYRRKFLKTLWIWFHPGNKMKCCQICCVFFTQKMIKNVIFNKTKNTRVRFLIYISSMCVKLFTAFEEAILKLYVPWWVP